MMLQLLADHRCLLAVNYIVYGSNDPEIHAITGRNIHYHGVIGKKKKE